MEISYCVAPYYYVDMATNGKEALDLILNNPPDLVLSDIMMPVMDGLELLKGRHFPFMEMTVSITRR